MSVPNYASSQQRVTSAAQTQKVQTRMYNTTSIEVLIELPIPFSTIYARIQCVKQDLLCWMYIVLILYITNCYCMNLDRTLKTARKLVHTTLHMAKVLNYVYYTSGLAIQLQVHLSLTMSDIACTKLVIVLFINTSYVTWYEKSTCCSFYSTDH